MRRGTHHVLSLWAFRFYKADREASCDDKVLCGHIMVIVLATGKSV